MELTDVDVEKVAAQGGPETLVIAEVPTVAPTGVSLWEPRLNMAIVSDDGLVVDALNSADLASAPPWKDKQCK